MKNFYQVFFCICLLIPVAISGKVKAQHSAIYPNSKNSHKLYIDLLQSAENRSYEDILAQYNRYIALHPNDINTQIEKCKFIGNSFYDSYDEYNPKQAEFDASLAALYRQFPGHPDVLLYKAEFTYGDSAIVLLENILQQAEENPKIWQHKPLWKVYENLANQYSYKEEYEQSITYANQAVMQNDTLDLTLLLARQYMALSRKEDAKAILQQKLDSLQPAWLLNQKAELLLELKQPTQALQAFRYAQKDTTVWANAASIGKALEQNREYAEARRYFVKAVKNNPQQYTALENLFLHDLHYQSKDSVSKSYQALRDLGFKADPLGKNRLTLFFNYPDLGWQLRDFSGVGMLLAVITGLILLPYLWILPIYSVGTYFKIDANQPVIPFRWRLRSFWGISSIYLLVTFFVLLLYSHASLLPFITLDLYVTTVATNSDTVTADSNLLFFIAMAFGTLLLLNRSDYLCFWQSVWPKRKIFLTGFLAAMAVKFAYGWSFVLFKNLFPEGFDMGIGQINWMQLSGAVDTEILALKNEYGMGITFFFVALLVPVYEEIIFRGIILASCEKYIHFFWANVLQALLFATIHQKPAYFIFYFAMGIVSGYLCAKSKGLVASISFHVVNNFLALLVILQ